MDLIPSDDLLARQTRQFMLGASGTVAYAAVLTVLLSLIGSAVAPSVATAQWTLVPLPSALLVICISGSYLAAQQRFSAQISMRAQLWALTSASISYGAAAAMAAASGVLAMQLLVLAFLLAAAIGVVHAMAAVRPAIVLWLLPLTIPSCVLFVWRGSDADLYLALTLALGMSLYLRVGLVTHENLLATLRYRATNEKLVVQLRDQMALVARASQEKTRFLAAAAHDLRQPLHALGLFGASLKDRLRDRPERPLVRNMQQAIEALETSFSSILDISRLDAGVLVPNLQVFPIRDLFRRMYLQYAGDAERQDVSLRFRTAGCVVKSDPQLLERIISNLVSNALRYTKQGGVLVTARRYRGAVRIEVWDTGIGIPRDKWELIFEEFYQIGNPERDRTRGIGMGLSIVRRICQLLEHEMEFRSVENRGTRFCVTVPSGSDGAADTLELDANTLPPRVARRFTVMVIDDEEPIRQAMVEFLVPQQISVLAAGSIAEAVELARAAESPVDMIFSDLRLRGGEDGIQAVREVRQVLGAGTPAVLLTGDTSSERLREAHEHGLIVIYKPLKAKQILSLINLLPA